ncbi:nucleotidyl transferase AbiEii/AbiGii toxin family protein [Duganella sp. FT27W]|uniref:nucleotidyl transferase AbiEii/AbiGii toxin family protein n=1 Tax=Duganella sp. FT27W TaxID=2654636 RepID=UPI00128B9B6C|nr:nucleotidyl transferase AbiEii/AbiGii toxin family protein [Duganella sp. FT27W]MPQ58233.1 hypothetical protein [Duganella sp. FT27W]
MRKIESYQSQKISDLINEKGLAIAEYALEKDFIVTAVLKVISQLNNDDFSCVFCGGTCLSKAYGLLARISEDVDFKVISKAVGVLGNSKRRDLLGALKRQAVECLVASGFPVEYVKVDKARNNNGYMLLSIAYESYFSPGVDLRAHVRLEFNHTQLSAPVATKKIGLLFDVLAGATVGQTFEVACIDLMEAAVEKLVLFPRRLALYRAHPGRIFDPSMVRHLYDIHQIAAAYPALFSPSDHLKSLMLTVIKKDAQLYSRQHPEFFSDPVGELNRVVEWIQTDAQIRQRYDRFIRVMVYGRDPPTFDMACNTFQYALRSAVPAPENPAH